jgi:hypothetical protein
VDDRSLRHRSDDCTISLRDIIPKRDFHKRRKKEKEKEKEQRIAWTIIVRQQLEYQEYYPTAACCIRVAQFSVQLSLGTQQRRGRQTVGTWHEDGSTRTIDTTHIARTLIRSTDESASSKHLVPAYPTHSFNLVFNFHRHAR